MIELTNGFVVRARNSMPAAWTPGIWWRMGRRIGVGGLTGEGEAMAELLAELSRGANSES